MRKLLLCWLFVLIVTPLAAQFYIAGQEQSSIKWQAKKTPYGKVLFPQGADSIALLFNKYMEYSWRKVALFTDDPPKPFSLIIHPNSVLSNGFVTWGPKRMEIISQHDFNPSPEPWLFTLSLHETRHIYQLDRLNKGIFRASTYLMGDLGILPAVGLVPLWFLEGDAVYTETNFSLGGRGRQSSFYQPFRTHLLHHGRNAYSYDKWLMGSYKNSIPNHYQFGYLMVGYGYLKHESNVWNRSFDFVTRRPYTLFPFYFGVKKETGLSRKNLFNAALQYLNSIWSVEEHHSVRDEFRSLAKRQKSYCEYHYPYLVDDSLLVSLKKSLVSSQAIVAIDMKTKKEKVLHRPGILTNRISCTNGNLFWSQYRPHYRWENLNYSELWKYDVRTRKAYRLTTQTRLFNPVAMQNGTLLAIEYYSNGRSGIVALTPNGYPVATHTLCMTLEPKEIATGKGNDFLVRASSPNGAVILKFLSIDTPPDTILGPVFKDISNIGFTNNKVLFTMTIDGREEVFALDTISRKGMRMSFSKYGLTHPTEYNDQLISSSWNEMGLYPVSFQPLKRNVEINMDQLIRGLFNEGGSSFQPNIITNFGDSVSSYSQPYKYSKLKGLFNFHSWAPFYFNPFHLMEGDVNVYPGASIFSQNLTGTMAAGIGYSYFETHGIHAHAHWMGWYPIISAGVDVGNTLPNIVHGPFADSLEDYRSDFLLKANFKVVFPFRLSSGSVFTQFNTGLKYSMSNTWLWDYEADRYEKIFNQLELFLSFSSVRRMAHRDLQPRVGIALYSGFTHSPMISRLKGNNFISLLELYLPGFWLNHGVKVTGKTEKDWVTAYLFKSRLKFPKGHNEEINRGFSSLGIDYALPLLYPDLSIGSVVYVKRLFANLFYDYAEIQGYRRVDGKLQPHNYSLSSTGIEVFSEANYFRTRYELRYGYRFGINLNKNTYFHEFLISLNPSMLLGHTQNNKFKIFNP